MSWETAAALFAITLVGSYAGFDLAFRVTAHRTREIAREEIDAERARRSGYAGRLMDSYEAALRRERVSAENRTEARRG